MQLQSLLSTPFPGGWDICGENKSTIMTIHFFIKTRAVSKPRTGSRATFIRVPLYVRIRDGRKVDQQLRTCILVNPFWWDRFREEVYCKSACPEKERLETNEAIISLRRYLTSDYLMDRRSNLVTDHWLGDKLAHYFHIDRYTGDLAALFGQFCNDREISMARRQQYTTLLELLLRFEAYVRMAVDKSFSLEVARINEKMLKSFQIYIKKEPELYDKYPDFYSQFGMLRHPRPRGRNTINDIFKKMRAFMNWCKKKGMSEVSPFENYKLGHELYGTPVCLTQEEVQTILSTRMEDKALEELRDIFVFQCNVGCRISDLVRLTEAAVVDAAISYIPVKTIRSRARTVVVPLNSIAKGIILKYAGRCNGRLLPFVSTQKYNIAIKRILRLAGITRLVTVLDPLTSCEKRVPICDVGSSHMARRSFINTLYGKVKDPALVASLTGHVEGSQAFSRYRDIDAKMKRELVELLD